MRSDAVNNTRVLQWIGCAAALLALSGCSLFLSPPKLRENPLDDQNPTPQVTELRAFGYSADSVKLRWQANFDGDGNYPNVIIVRNSVQEPTSISDGELVYDGVTAIADGDVYMEYTDESAAEDTDYHYAIWSYSDQDGTIAYNGPVTDSASTKLVDVEIPVFRDGYLRAWNGGPWDLQEFDLILELQSAPGSVERFILLEFDFGSAPDFGVISSARLRLYKDNAGPIMDWIISAGLIIQDWDYSEGGLSLYTKIISGPFTDFSDDVNASETLVLGGTDGFYYWDVQDIVEAWLISNKPNYGILVRSRDIDFSDWYAFRSSEWGDASSTPVLELQYYGDNPDIE